MYIFHNKLFIFLLFVFFLLIIILLVSVYECNRYVLTTFNVNNNKNSDKLKLVFISDFHNKKYKNHYEDIVNSIIDANPDYIILGGDFINFSKFQSFRNIVDYDKSKEFIQVLVDKFKSSNNYNLKNIFFGYGNHELRLIRKNDNVSLKNCFLDFRDFLLKNNIILLDDISYKLSNGISISGSSLYDGYYGKFKGKTYKNISSSVLDEHFKDIDKSNYNIMVFHKPDYAEDFINYGYDLVLSGHNHGGLISIPFIGPIISSDLVFFPKYGKGHYNYKNGDVIVSSGLGEHTIHIRVNNPPEIVVININ